MRIGINGNCSCVSTGSSADVLRVPSWLVRRGGGFQGDDGDGRADEETSFDELLRELKIDLAGYQGE